MFLLELLRSQSDWGLSVRKRYPALPGWQVRAWSCGDAPSSPASYPPEVAGVSLQPERAQPEAAWVWSLEVAAACPHAEQWAPAPAVVASRQPCVAMASCNRRARARRMTRPRVEYSYACSESSTAVGARPSRVTGRGRNSAADNGIFSVNVVPTPSADCT